MNNQSTYLPPSNGTDNITNGESSNTDKNETIDHNSKHQDLESEYSNNNNLSYTDDHNRNNNNSHTGSFFYSNVNPINVISNTDNEKNDIDADLGHNSENDALDNDENNNNNNENAEDKTNEENKIETKTSDKLPRATLEQKIEVLDWYHNAEKKCQQITVKHFKKLNQFAITKSTMNRWVLGEEKLRTDFKNMTLNNKGMFRTRPHFKYPEINRCLEIYYQQLCNENVIVTEPALIRKWHEFYNFFYPENINKMKKSNGWLHHFKKANLVKKELAKNFYSSFQLNNPVDNKLTNNNSLLITSIEADRGRIQRELSDYNPDEIYQLDEISINLRSHMFNNTSSTTLINDLRNKLTIGILVNATGFNFKQPLILSSDPIFETQGVNATNEYKEEDTDIYYSKTGLLTSEVVFKYLTKIDKELSMNNQESIVILLDPLHAHFIPLDEFSKIKLVYFSPLFTNQLYYPLDYGVKKMFKLLFKYQMFNYFTLNNTLNISGLQAVKFILETSRIIANNYTSFISLAFQSSNILPNRPHSNNDIKLLNNSVHLELESYKASEVVKFIKTLAMKNQLTFDLKQHTATDDELLDQILFPYDEVVENVHLSDLDIVEYAKLDMDFIQTQKQKLPQEDLNQAQLHQLHPSQPQQFQSQAHIQFQNLHPQQPKKSFWNQTDQQRSSISHSAINLISIDDLLKHDTPSDHLPANSQNSQNIQGYNSTNQILKNRTSNPINSNESGNGNGNGIVDVAIAAALAFNKDINKSQNVAAPINRTSIINHTLSHNNSNSNTQIHNNNDTGALNSGISNAPNDENHILKKRKVSSGDIIRI